MSIYNSKLYKDYSQIKKLHDKLNHILNLLEEAFNNNDIFLAYKLSLEFVLISERLNSVARLMPIATGVPTAFEDVQKVIVKNSEIVIDYIDNGESFYMKIPALLPKKEQGGVGYIRTLVQGAMNEYFKENNKKVFDEKVVIVFKHNYSKERNKRRYRDHDNIEINAIVDLIALYVLIDDSADRCYHYYFSAEAKEDSTEVFVIKEDKFIDFLERQGSG